MRKLPEVQEAKELMAAARDWSVFTWMFQKSRVRETADRANAALDRLDRNVKAHWSDTVKAAYKELSAKAVASARRSQNSSESRSPSGPPLKLLVEKVKAADSLAHRARMDAEKTFDEAERQLNLSLAREGCEKAIHSWTLHEKAIRAAEVIADSANHTA